MTSKRPLILSILVACALLFGCASVVREPIRIEAQVLWTQSSLDEKIAAADIIATGKVIAIEPSHWNTANGRLPPGSTPDSLPRGLTVYTDAEFQVAQLLKGDVQEAVLRVRTFGGTVGRDSMTFSGEPILERGKEYLLFLYEDTGTTADIGPEHYLVSGPMEDVFVISDGKAVSENDEWELEDLIRYIQAPPTPWASPDLGEYLLRRYQEFDVPVMSVEVTQEQPLVVTVTWRTEATGEKGTPDDPIYSHIVQREIDLASLQGYAIDSYVEIVVNQVGEQVTWGSGSVGQQEGWLLDTTPARLTDLETEILIHDRLDSHGLRSLGLEVNSSEGLQTVELVFWTPSVDMANQLLPAFMASLEPQLDALNAEGAHIVSCRVEVWDKGDQMLLNYIVDLRIGIESWWMAEGITGGWFPEPAPAGAP